MTISICLKSRSGRPLELKYEVWQTLLNQYDSQSSVQLDKQLQVDHTTVLRRLHTMEKIQKEESAFRLKPLKATLCNG